MSKQRITDKIMSKPRGRKGGRKPSFTPPKDKRTAQLRASQNAFRKRKLERLEELEKKEAQLKVTNDQIHILKKENELLNFMLGSLLTERNMSSDERNITKTCCEKNPFPNNILDGSVIFSTTYNSLEIQKCYVFFKQLLSICAGKSCTVPSPWNSSDRSFYPIGCTNLSADVADQSFLDDPISEVHTFDFNGKLDNIFSKPSGTQIEDPNNFFTEEVNAMKTAAASTAITPGFDSRQCCTTDSFQSDVLLNAMDIWHFIKVHSRVNTLDLENLGTELKKNAICSNFDILISLKHFVKVFSSKL
ncbi:Arr1p [Saccharomyces cerevisiae x Saccharomyces kudriavzevii VIN7]|uniref:Arr1p n=1 Tax=Saccharomyces cerevisiae x Saccharomyces kudriavzevii (strain VIN7) TaxID=1095631 RepID=H0GYU6_SACCK|nr:Arr1p [Saccharomyces cerevisiae x Saccharomyces kudriavzevii VIN7]